MEQNVLAVKDVLRVSRLFEHVNVRLGKLAHVNAHTQTVKMTIFVVKHFEIMTILEILEPSQK